MVDHRRPRFRAESPSRADTTSVTSDSPREFAGHVRLRWPASGCVNFTVWALSVPLHTVHAAPMSVDLRSVESCPDAERRASWNGEPLGGPEIHDDADATHGQTPRLSSHRCRPRRCDPRHISVGGVRTAGPSAKADQCATCRASGCPACRRTTGRPASRHGCCGDGRRPRSRCAETSRSAAGRQVWRQARRPHWRHADA